MLSKSGQNISRRRGTVSSKSGQPLSWNSCQLRPKPIAAQPYIHSYRVANKRSIRPARHCDKLLFTFTPIRRIVHDRQSLDLPPARRAPACLSTNKLANKLAAIPRDTRHDVPLRAKSVCLTERPRSQYARTVRSADQNKRYADKFYRQRPSSKIKYEPKPSDITVKPQKRKVVEKVPCAVSVQNLSIPMKYDRNKPKHSTSKQNKIDNRTKSRNPPKQVSDKRLCDTVGCGKETENKLLLEISEADQVTDFERILNSNAILSERVHGHVWRRLANAPSAAVLPRPRSSYSLYTVSQAYHYLFQQHEDSLKPLIDQYRQDTSEKTSALPESFLRKNWYENLQDLSEFYEEDQALKQEIETITDRLITEEVKAADEKRNNFNVNLADLIRLNVTGEGCSPIPPTSPDIDKLDGDDEKEWLSPIMNGNSDDSNQDSPNVDCLAQNLNSVKIDSDAKVPTITFSNCCDGRAKSDSPNSSEVVIHLAVPSIDSIDEARPPMM